MRKEIIRQQNLIREKWLALTGAFPAEKPQLNVEIREERETAKYRMRKVAFRADARYDDDIITAWLLLPHGMNDRTPAVLCLHPTTFGCGKAVVTGEVAPYLEQAAPAERSLPPSFWEDRAYAKHLAERGYIVLAPDTYADGERVEAGHRPYEPVDFYRRYPQWSMVGKAIWDHLLCMDFLVTVPGVDVKNIGVIGHSLGGHSAVFVAGFDERIKATVTNGGCTIFRKYMEHWSRLPLPESLVREKPPVYCYLPAFRPYLGNHDLENPVTFADLMGLICPRFLLYAGATSNSGMEGGLEVLQETWDGVYDFYARAGAAERVHYHIYPGNHGFPPRARDYEFNWLDARLKSKD